MSSIHTVKCDTLSSIHTVKSDTSSSIHTVKNDTLSSIHTVKRDTLSSIHTVKSDILSSTGVYTFLVHPNFIFIHIVKTNTAVQCQSSLLVHLLTLTVPVI